MPLIILEVMIQILAIAHAVKTGKDRIWITVLIFLPLAGVAAYLLIEVLPDLLKSKPARQALDRAQRMADPEKRLRGLREQLEITDTIANRQAVAEECLALEKYAEAIAVIEPGLTAMHQFDPDLLLVLAAARFGAGDAAAALATLDRLREHNPEYQSENGHLLYARCLEALGCSAEAEAEYLALTGYFSGAEARFRYGLLLAGLGRDQEAKDQFRQLVHYYERSRGLYRERERNWYQQAKARLQAS